MPKALVFNVPAYGHVNPSLPLVAELVRRGHQITYCITPHYRASVEAVGAVFHPYAAVHDDFFTSRALHGGVPQKVAYELITTTEAILPELLVLAHGAQPDYIIFDGMCPWGYFVARILHRPAVASLSLLPVPSPHALLKWQALRVALPMLLRDVGKGLEANTRSRALGKQYAVPPLGPTSILNALGDISLSYTSSYFQPAASTVSPTVRFVGWTLSETSREAWSFEQVQGRRLIYVSLGTVFAWIKSHSRPPSACLTVL